MAPHLPATLVDPTTFPALLRDLQQLERVPVKTVDRTAAGRTILDAFLQNTSAECGAVYFCDTTDSDHLLAASSCDDEWPGRFSCEFPDEPQQAVPHVAAGLALQNAVERLEWSPLIVPLSSKREQIGFIALGTNSVSIPSPDELDLVRTASRFASALLSNRRMAGEVRQGEFQLKYKLWELEALYDIGLSIASTLDLDQLADEILTRSVSLLNARRAALYLRDGEQFRLHSSFGDVRSLFFGDDIDTEITKRLIFEGVPIRFDQGADCIFPGCESFVALPIQNGAACLGVLAAADRELREGGVGAFEENDVRLLSLFANQAAIALENARLHREALEKQTMEREIELAATIQRDILPRGVPTVEGFQIAAMSRPARQLGGDYHAFFEHEGKLTICVADVSGKSVPAAILVSALHAALALLVDEGKDIDAIATDLNRHIHHWSSENKFITMVLATIDPEAGVLRYVNAGHNPAYVLRGSVVSPLDSNGLPIGILGKTRYSVRTEQFPPGSRLFVYSDGITEAENLQDEEFGDDRLCEILAKNAENSVDEMTAAVSKAVDEFVGSAPQKDDQTIVVIAV